MQSSSFSIASVLYNPASDSIARLVYFARMGHELLLYDNSVTPSNHFSNFNNVHYYHFGKNVGLSVGIDFLCRRSIDLNLYKMIFFDQDTQFTLDTLDFINEVTTFVQLKENIFDLTIAINFLQYSPNNRFNVKKIITNNSFEIHEVFFNINSGTLFLLSNFNNYKWFDRRFFVDGVDYAFSIEAVTRGFNILAVSNTPGLNHEAEQGDAEVYFLNYSFISRLYPLSRNFDYLGAHFILIYRSLFTNSFLPFLFLLRGIVSYVFHQVIFRFHSFFKIIFGK
jgi:rhamnosyltransferase